MNRHVLAGLFVWALLFSPLAVVVGQDVASEPRRPKSAKAPADSARRLFADDSVLHFTLTTNLRALLTDRGDTRGDHSVLLTYADAQQRIALPLRARVRGNFRRSAINCLFPPLLLDFPKKKTRGTPFENQNKLKLVTHCQTEEYVVREYLVYKLYNLVTDLSFQARLARVTYVDSVGKRPSETHWAFLLEDENAMAQRNGGTLHKPKQANDRYLDSLGMATVAVFEYLIGNTDWSVRFLHNMRLVSLSANQRPLPVPYDFDHSGIVEAKYAFPAQQLPIQSVRERLYRGQPYPMHLFQKVFDRFNQLRPQFYALYRNETRLSPAYVKRTLKYLDDFYATINRPASVSAEFLKGDRTGIVIKGLK